MGKFMRRGRPRDSAPIKLINRNTLTEILEKEIERLPQILDTIEDPYDRIRAWRQFLPYLLPKMSEEQYHWESTIDEPVVITLKLDNK